jgi:uncharacterized protein involved in exopolysaccharide biosynthesis
MSASPSSRPEIVDAAPSRASTWWTPDGEVSGIPRYIEAIRAGRWIIIAAVVAACAAAGLYLARADEVYEASADVLVTPRDLAVAVSGTLTPSSDPTRNTETVARLAESATVARRVIVKLNLDEGPQYILGKISADPVASSDIVSIRAEWGTAQGAQDLADAFATEFVDYRTERFHETLDGMIASLRSQTDDTPTDPANPESPVSQLEYLESLRGADDPNVRVETPAELPTGTVSPRPLLTGVAAVIGGLIIGLLGAFGLQLLDPRLRREEQLRAQFRLPILARIPLEKRRIKRPLLPSELSLGALDGYQALRAAARRPRRSTSPPPSPPPASA